MNIERCKEYGDIKKAKVLVIGHDPTLRRSKTIAEYCFFADYHSKTDLNGISDKRKKGLADSLFQMIHEITNNKYSDEEIYITNLCNEKLELGDGEVYIPKIKAIEGINNIKKLLEKGDFQYIFATSLQVNYWLQKLNFYKCEDDFLKNTRISPKALRSKPRYFKVTKSKTFHYICGNVYEESSHKVKVIPVLHPKNYPLEKNKNIKKEYEKCYENIKNYFKNNSL